MRLNILSTSKSNIGNFYLIIGVIGGLLGNAMSFIIKKVLPKQRNISKKNILTKFSIKNVRYYSTSTSNSVEKIKKGVLNNDDDDNDFNLGKLNLNDLEPNTSNLSGYFKNICYESTDSRVENLKNFIDNYTFDTSLDDPEYPNLYFIRHFGALYNVFFDL